ncbi:MAG: DNA replication/repair protein RecF [Oscillospiraceae bacterium]|nr:DNA replication/repair protein RecF [Oscillospiraceae bacterium]
MNVKRVNLTNFRNISEAEIYPAEGINVICGENAQGKTNLLEAVWLFTGLKSFRSAKDAEMIKFNENYTLLETSYESESGENIINVALGSDKRKQVKLNGIGLESAISLAGEFYAVVFAPSHLSLIKGGPAERRRFADGTLCQLKPKYAAALIEYSNVLRHRNALLKDAGYHSELMDTLPVWDEKLGEAGGKIRSERKEYASRLNETAAAVYAGISGGKECLEIKYAERLPSGFDGTEPMTARIQKGIKTDMMLKSTSYGPHRDDLDIWINGLPSRAYGSQGQQRSAALSLKLAEADIIKESTGEQPVILLDDVMSELDMSRQDYILNRIKNRQVFVTCCDKNTILRLYEGKVFEIKKGSIII